MKMVSFVCRKLSEASLVQSTRQEICSPGQGSKSYMENIMLVSLRALDEPLFIVYYFVFPSDEDDDFVVISPDEVPSPQEAEELVSKVDGNKEQVDKSTADDLVSEIVTVCGKINPIMYVVVINCFLSCLTKHDIMCFVFQTIQLKPLITLITCKKECHTMEMVLYVIGN